jgi:lysophospholipase L1-like esterase
MQNPLSCIPTKRTEEWWLKRHTDKLNEIAKSQGNFDLVFIGDSIVHAWELEGEAAWNQHFKQLQTLNLGFSGDRTEHVLWRIQQGELDNFIATYVVLLIGTNNAGHRHDKPEEIAAGVESILQSIRQKLPQSTIILTAIFPRSRTPLKRMRKAVDASNILIRKLTDDNSVIWFDINEHLLNDEGILLESVMPDLLHPNQAQYQLWAKEINARFADKLSPPTKPSL